MERVRTVAHREGTNRTRQHKHDTESPPRSTDGKKPLRFVSLIERVPTNLLRERFEDARQHSTTSAKPTHTS